MVEELYIIKDDKRIRLDLNTPSGLTLNYKSNIFSDLSKITCSYSYTFTLPMTVNNRLAFEFAEDVRHQSSMIRKKLKAEYWQNGIPLFSNANLYLDSASNVYKAVMTWDVLDGMQKMTDDDISLKKLPIDKEIICGRVDEGTQGELFDNNADALFPMYNCGIPYFYWNTMQQKVAEGHRQPSLQRYSGYATFPVPVVPVYKIVKLINEYYGTNFNLGNHLGIGQASQFNTQREVFEKGVVPLCGRDLTYDQRYKRRAVFSGLRTEYINKTIELYEGSKTFYDVIYFDSIKIEKDDFLYPGSFKAEKPDTAGNWYNNAGIHARMDNISIEADGCFLGGFYEVANDESPTLSFVQIQKLGVVVSSTSGNRVVGRVVYKWVELASITGEAVGTFNNGATAYRFDFASIHGASRLTFDGEKYWEANSSQWGGGTGNVASPVVMLFSHRIGYLEMEDKDMEFFIVNSDKVTMSHAVDLASNLPDISCMTFMKSLFYMMGTYPYVDKNGNITARLFSEIKDNLDSGKTIDWSSKIIKPFGVDSDSEVKFSQSSSYAQKNYYMMKSDELEPEIDPEDIEEDVYESGLGCIQVEDSTLSVSQTVIQVPFYPPYIKNNKFPYLDTGNTIKAWTLVKNDEASSSRANTYVKEYCIPYPALGIIEDREYGHTETNGVYTKDGERMSMRVWNGFQNLSETPALTYFQEILRKPFVVTEKLRLNEFDLLNLDYTIPVYLEKYNSYFGIVSISRDSKGVCKCELIKLP